MSLVTNCFYDKEDSDKLKDKVIYTGSIDEYFNYSLGKLGWTSLKLTTKVFDEVNHQENVVVNYT